MGLTDSCSRFFCKTGRKLRCLIFSMISSDARPTKMTRRMTRSVSIIKTDIIDVFFFTSYRPDSVAT